MSGTETFAYVGAVLLGIATIPQAVSLLRRPDVSGFGWAFSVCNFVGLGFLAARSLAIGEWAFLGINTITTAFWGMIVVLKLRGVRQAQRGKVSALLPPSVPDAGTAEL